MKSKSKLWLLILMMSISYVLPIDYARINGSIGSTEASRYRRASDDIIDNLQRLSRIASGIAVEIGLKDNSLSSNDAIAELLHLGALKLEDVLDLDKATITSALDTLKSLPTPDDPVKQVEKRLIDLDEIRKTSEFMLGFGNFTGKEEYRKSLDEINKLSAIDISGFQTSNVDFTALGASLTRYRNYPDELTDANVADIEIYLRTDISYMNKVEASVTVLDPIVAQIKEAKKLLDHADFLDILYDEKKIRDKLPIISYREYVDNIIENIKTLKKDQETLKTLKAPLEILNALVDTRAPTFHPTFKITSGLPKGSSDLEQLSKDTANSWINGRVGDSKVVIDGLDKALHPYRDLAVKLKDVEKFWNPNLQESEFLKILKAFSNVLSINGDLQPIFDTMKEMLKYDENKPTIVSDPFAAKLEKIKVKIGDLNLKISQMTSFDYVEGLKNLTPLKQVLTTTAKIDKPVATKIVSDLKDVPLFSEALNIMPKLNSDLTTLPTIIGEVSALATDIVKDYRDIQDYYKSVNNPSYIQFFQDLHDVGDKGSDVKKIIQILNSTRLTPETISTGSSSIDNILASKGFIQKAQTSAESLKEIDEAFKNSFKDYQAVSQNLGMGVQGLLVIRKAHEAKKDLAPLLENVDSILQLSTGLAQVHQDSLKKLNDLVSTFNGIDQFEGKLAGYQALRKKRNANFKSVEDIFDDAAQIPDFKEVLKDAIKVLNSPIPGIQTAIDKLEELDLEFAKFKFGDAKNSLEALDNFFLEYVKAKTTPPSTSPPPPPPVDPSSDPLSVTGRPVGASPSSPSPDEAETPSELIAEDSEFTTKSGESSSGFLDFCKSTLGIILFAILGIFAVASIIICCFCCKKNNDDPYIPDEDHHKDTEPPAVTPTGELKKEDPPAPPKIPEGPVEKKETPKENPKETPKENPKETSKETPKPDETKHDNGASSDSKDNKESDAKVVVVAKEKKVEVKDDTHTAIEPTLPVERTQEIIEEEIFVLANNTLSSIEAFRLGIRSPQEWADGYSANESGITIAQMEDHLTERRKNEYICREECRFRVSIGDGYIYCNYKQFEFRWYITMHPFKGGEPIMSKWGLHYAISTMCKFFALLIEADIKIVIKLSWTSQFTAPYFAEEVGKELTFDGRFTIKTTGKRANMAEFTDSANYTLWQIEIYDLKSPKKAPKLVHILHYSDWQGVCAPKYPDPVLEIIEFADLYKGHVLLQCPDGVTRSGAILAVKQGIELCIKSRITAVTDVINPVRQVRYGAVQTADQVTYVVLCLTKYLMKKTGVRFLKNYWAVYYYHRALQDRAYDELNKYKAVREQKIKAQELREDKDIMKKFVAAKEEEHEKLLMKEAEVKEAKEAEVKEDKKTEANSKKSKKSAKKSKNDSKKTGSKEGGSKKTGSKKTGSKKTGSKKTGSKKTGSKKAGLKNKP
ncbi:hypothetical protein CAEBREN_14393 [Caenorhabditis brenneri]|uniref:Tyrosine-protein phosphatase domain-containing protein n=1 Tax=Caenorhabditis brenneri TaxID=135651 RepID=G0MMD2_CAEBE|nr:hypothetical protein CAEBREN_14393 [Caenorhabditis brenneri]